MKTSKSIDKILVANRGEIALRVMRTCRRLGIATIAVFSDADEDMPFVRFADEAVRIGPAPAASSYLAIETIIAAARRTGADAIHPGYGFLSENATFAQACTGAGLTFIGPRPEVIHLLGSKREAKVAASRAGVPIVPGYSGDDQRIETLTAHALELGFPLLVKASAGGGGKGMRVVRARDELHDAIERARSEAKNAFGDDTLLLERYVERPRHVEIQILGDHHGELIHLWERECSIQRRHQKVIEEAPSPALDDALRAAMGAAGVAVGKAVHYTSAGTVEFIVAPDGGFYFLEVNTRLQVEHPVTEAITGIDLVEQQIRIARGEHLAVAAPPIRGHAIEVRLYAEDADAGYLPTTGRILDWRFDDVPGLRVDAGVETGSEVGIHYDPMLAKVIAHAATRHDAIVLLRRSLERASIAGLTTNREHLHRVLGHPAFQAGELDTHFLEHHAEALRAPPAAPGRIRAAAVAATLAGIAARRFADLPHVEPGWRNVPFADPVVAFAVADRRVEVGYRNLGGGRFLVAIDGARSEVRLVGIETATGAGAREIVFEDDGYRLRRRVVGDGARWHVEGLVLVEEPRFPEALATAVAGGLTAPMPGKVVKVLVETGQAVAAGASLLVLEAMKMEQTIRAPSDGVVAALLVAAGDQVDADQLLAVVAPVV